MPLAEVSTLAGKAGSMGSSDGVGDSARFIGPNGIPTRSGTGPQQPCEFFRICPNSSGRSVTCLLALGDCLTSPNLSPGPTLRVARWGELMRLSPTAEIFFVTFALLRA